MNERLLTLDEVAELGRVSKRTVERELQRGRLQVVKVGGLNRVRESEALRWAGLPTAPQPAG